MKMLVSQYHLNMPILNRNSIISTIVGSKENIDFLTTLLYEHYSFRFDNYNDPIQGLIIDRTKEACSNFTDFFEGGRFGNSHTHISAINKSIMKHIMDNIPEYSYEIDPLWTQKGPTFKESIIGNNRHPLLKMGVFGPTYATPQSKRVLEQQETRTDFKRISVHQILG